MQSVSSHQRALSLAWLSWLGVDVPEAVARSAFSAQQHCQGLVPHTGSLSVCPNAASPGKHQTLTESKCF